jgi:hypothetical protein
MKIEIIGRGPITPAQLDEILFGTSTINKKNPLEEAIEAMDKLRNVAQKKDAVGKYSGKPICFDIQSITANHKKNAFTVVWGDGSHTIVHLQKGDVWDDEKALAMCFVKHMMGDTGSFNDIFTEEMPAKIKHIGKVEPIEEKHECHCDTPCKDCSCKKEDSFAGTVDSLKKAGATATKSVKDVIGLSNEIEGFLKKLAEEPEPVKVQRYDLFLIDPDGSAKEIYHQGTDGEIHKAMRAYRMKHYPILEANRTPYRVWQRDGSLFVDFGAGSYFKVPGMEHDTFVKGK